MSGGRCWAEVKPLLDEAMQSLEDTDRTAVLLRYFENKSFREVGEAIGASEDAAQKPVSRAVERLRDLLAERKVAVGAGALALAISANAVQAAPAGLAATLVAGAGVSVGVSAISASTAVTVAKTIAMTTIQKTAVGLFLAGAVGTAIYQTHRASTLSEQVQVLEQKQAAQAGLMKQVEALQREHEAVPILNLRNMASEQQGERSLKLLDDIYQRAVGRASSFLTAEDLTKFEEFRKLALSNSRTALNVNRTIMAPIAN